MGWTTPTFEELTLEEAIEARPLRIVPPAPDVPIDSIGNYDSSVDRVLDDPNWLPSVMSLIPAGLRHLMGKRDIPVRYLDFHDIPVQQWEDLRLRLNRFHLGRGSRLGPDGGGDIYHARHEEISPSLNDAEPTKNIVWKPEIIPISIFDEEYGMFVYPHIWVRAALRLDESYLPPEPLTRIASPRWIAAPHPNLRKCEHGMYIPAGESVAFYCTGCNPDHLFKTTQKLSPDSVLDHQRISFNKRLSDAGLSVHAGAFGPDTEEGRKAFRNQMSYGGTGSAIEQLAGREHFRVNTSSKFSRDVEYVSERENALQEYVHFAVEKEKRYAGLNFAVEGEKPEIDWNAKLRLSKMRSRMRSRRTQHRERKIIILGSEAMTPATIAPTISERTTKPCTSPLHSRSAYPWLITPTRPGAGLLIVKACSTVRSTERSRTLKS
jgi:hypothetical protein